MQKTERKKNCANDNERANDTGTCFCLQRWNYLFPLVDVVAYLSSLISFRWCPHWLVTMFFLLEIKTNTLSHWLDLAPCWQMKGTANKHLLSLSRRLSACHQQSHGRELPFSTLTSRPINLSAIEIKRRSISTGRERENLQSQRKSLSYLIYPMRSTVCLFLFSSSEKTQVYSTGY